MFDVDHHSTNIRSQDVQLAKRRYKVYRGFMKEELEPFTDEQAVQYFERSVPTFKSNCL